MVPPLPLRADVLQVNALFEEMSEGEFTEEWMQQYTGEEDLTSLNRLSIQVDSVLGGQRCEMIGELLPNLQHLKLSESRIHTIRDLGTSLSNLKVLWLSRSFVQDLGGITTLPVLEELYLAFNDISDLSPLWMHDSLQVLDLEGNAIGSFEDVRSLEAVYSLRNLSINLNPVCQEPTFSREAVFDAIPSLEVLDDLTRDGSDAAHAQDGLEGLQTPFAALDSEEESLGVYEDDGSSIDMDTDDEEEEHEEGKREARCAAMLSEVPLEENQDLPQDPPYPGLTELRKRAGKAAPIIFGPSPAPPASSSSGPSRVPGPPVRPQPPTSREAASAGGAPRRRVPGASTRKPPRVQSEALAALREGRARLKAQLEAAASARRGAGSQALGATANDGLDGRELPTEGSFREPSEMELVVEAVKRAPRPVASLVATSSSARSASYWSGRGGERPAGDRAAADGSGRGRSMGTPRQLQSQQQYEETYRKRALSARPSTGSTSYRPTTSSSSWSSSHAVGMSIWQSHPNDDEASNMVAAASDLTAGDDGSALVGGALSAARRRRKLADSSPRTGALDDQGLGIRGLLRCYEAAAASEWLAEGFRTEGAASNARAETPRGARPQTPDVRIRGQRDNSPHCPTDIIDPIVAMRMATPRGGERPESRAKRRASKPPKTPRSTAPSDSVGPGASAAQAPVPERARGPSGFGTPRQQQEEGSQLQQRDRQQEQQQDYQRAREEDRPEPQQWQQRLPRHPPMTPRPSATGEPFQKDSAELSAMRTGPKCLPDSAASSIRPPSASRTAGQRPARTARGFVGTVAPYQEAPLPVS